MNSTSRLYLAGRLAPLAVVFAVMAFAACGTPAERRQDAKSALDAASVACVVANAALPDDSIAQVCTLFGALSPELRKIASAARVQREDGRAAGAARCQAQDAGSVGR